MTKKKILSEEDLKTWENYINDPLDVYDKEKNNLQNISRTNRKERFKFDLHGYTLNEANQKVREIIVSCVKKKYKEILFITGKGLHSTSDSDTYVSKNLSKLKYSVPNFIKNNEDLNRIIISLSDADNKDGGEGAILIKLRNL